MKPVIYKEVKGIEVLDEGIYQGRHYAIIMIAGNHPCAYVEILGNPKENYMDYDIQVHGGVTFGNTPHWDSSFDKNIWYIGWDYAHYGDYCSCYENLMKDSFGANKKWTTEEIFEEVKSVIEQLNMRQ